MKSLNIDATAFFSALGTFQGEPDVFKKTISARALSVCSRRRTWSKMRCKARGSNTPTKSYGPLWFRLWLLWRGYFFGRWQRRQCHSFRRIKASRRARQRRCRKTTAARAGRAQYILMTRWFMYVAARQHSDLFEIMPKYPDHVEEGERIKEGMNTRIFPTQVVRSAKRETPAKTLFTVSPQISGNAGLQK